MKKIGLFILMGLLFINNVDAEQPAKNVKEFKVQTLESKVFWTGKKLSSEHVGVISIKYGEIVLDGDEFVGAKINIDMSSIICTDITNAEYNQKLIGHLKSDDFFSVAKFPESTFKATQFVAIS